MTYTFVDFIGNVGVLLILSMYIAIQMEKIDSKKPLYSILNGSGALLVLVSLYFEFNLSAFIIEFFWLIVSIYGLHKSLQPTADAK